MAYSRPRDFPVRPDDVTLTRRMAGIGMNWATEADTDAQIEETLVFASELGVEEHDFRVLAALTTWLEVHHGRINADRLTRLVRGHASKRVHAYWAAIASWLVRDRRLARLRKFYVEPSVDLLPVGTDFQVARRGEDARFAGSALRVPADTLRSRPADVVSPEALVRMHRGYRNRVLMGPTWRADVWSALEEAPEIPAAEAARRTGCSFAAAWQVVQDFRLLRSAEQEADSRVAQRDRLGPQPTDGAGAIVGVTLDAP